MEFEKEHKPPQDDGDPFTNLMFGKKRRAREEENTNPPDELPDHHESSHAPQRDPWLFGANSTHNPPHIHNQYNQIEHLLNQVDIILLMETVDEAVKTYKLYQPIFKDVSTYLRKFFKK
ncbi:MULTISPECIES: hypothetical protein [Neobacillus]|uniref:Uncharacterized protein n=1 Tax=Neobacillus rhizophilus TaxID=2833579 RepID=A0A942YX66_9BACI|nr:MULTISPECIES: hypothetical protein [Neobacillus]MBS4214770.1 hypothetical protein [Neobacillus rhizophilus]